MDNLCFCSAAFGSWGIVRLGSLAPECQMLFVCPYSCGRHNSIGAIKHGYKDKISYLFIDEHDIALGTMNEDIPEAVEIILNKEKKPKVVLIYFSCVLYMSGFDWDAMMENLSETYPDVEFRACMMNPVAANTSNPPVPSMVRTLASLWDEDAEEINAVNILGNYTKLSEECELKDVLKECGIDRISHFTDSENYEDYKKMGGSRLNLVVRPEGLLAAKAWKKKMGYCYAPVSYDLEEVKGQYEEIFEALGKSADLSKYEAQAKEEIAKTLEAVKDIPVSVGQSAVCRPFGLAKTLIDYGFNVTDVFYESVSDFDKDAKKYLEEKGTVSFYQAQEPARVDAVGKMGESKIAIGFSAGYYSGAEHIVNLMIDEEMFGYYGICALMRKIREAVGNTESLETMIDAYGLII